MPDTEEATGGTAPTAPVQVITATRNLKSQPFNPGDDPTAQVKRGTTGSKESSANSDISRLRNPLTRKMHSSFMAGRKSLVWRKAYRTQRMAVTTMRS